MELRNIITEFLDLSRRLKNGLLPESLARDHEFRLADLDDLLTLDCQPSKKRSVPENNKEKDELIGEILNDIEKYNSFISLYKANSHAVILAEKELQLFKKELENFESKEIDSYLKKRQEIEKHSVERKKKKGGEYDYFIANDDGEVVSKISEEINDFERLDMYFDYYSYKISYMMPVFNNEKQYGEYIKNAKTETQSNENNTLIESQVILDHKGQIIFDGIETISINRKFTQFILRLNDNIYFSKRPKEFNSKIDGLWCVIDGDGKYIIDPTVYRIRFNNEILKYELF